MKIRDLGTGVGDFCPKLVGDFEGKKKKEDGVKEDYEGDDDAREKQRRKI